MSASVLPRLIAMLAGTSDAFDAPAVRGRYLSTFRGLGCKATSTQLQPNVGPKSMFATFQAFIALQLLTQIS